MATNWRYPPAGSNPATPLKIKIMDVIRTKYEKKVISLVESTEDNETLGKLIREWYLKNKEDLKYETPKSFRESNYTEQGRYNDYKNGTSFGMK